MAELYDVWELEIMQHNFNFQCQTIKIMMIWRLLESVPNKCFLTPAEGDL